MLREGKKAMYFELFVSLESKTVERRVPVPAGHHVGMDVDEMIALEVRRLQSGALGSLAYRSFRDSGCAHGEPRVPSRHQGPQASRGGHGGL